MENPLYLGWRTAILMPSMIVMMLIAAALFVPLRNRLANRMLAILLLVLTGIVTPWAIGFAGFYDRWPWLGLVPFSNPLAVAPLLYCYLHSLIMDRLPGRFWLHMAPAMIYATVLLTRLLLPLEASGQWSQTISSTLDVLAIIGIVAGFIGYGAVSLGLLGRYRTWLASQRSDDNRFAAQWIKRAIIGACALLIIWAAYEVANTLQPLSYMGYMGLYIAICIFGAALAIEGWRHAQMPWPKMEGDAAPVLAASEGDGRDWSAAAEEWVAAIRSDRLYEDPEFSLSRAARHIGTNQTYLSRAINDGLGMNFSTLVNSMRSEAVAARLKSEPSGDILAIALESGFNSKASFNRFFRAHYGKTPSAYRRETSQNP